MTALAVVLACAALAFALAALWAVRRVRAQLRDYGESLDAVVITGMRRDHFNLAHNVTQLEAKLADLRKMVNLQDVELNQAQDTIEAHGQALQDVRAELFNRKDTRASPASECTCNRPE